MKKVDSVVLIDDDPIFQFVTQKVIEETKLINQLQIFSNGQQGIDSIISMVNNGECLPDIIFLDLSMPILDGWGFLEEYSKIKPLLKKEILIYIVSSSIDPMDVYKAKKNSVVRDFIMKPITREILLEIIEND